MSQATAWGLIIAVAWGLSLWTAYSIGWVRGNTAGILWATDIVYPKVNR